MQLAQWRRAQSDPQGKGPKQDTLLNESAMPSPLSGTLQELVVRQATHGVRGVLIIGAVALLAQSERDWASGLPTCYLLLMFRPTRRVSRKLSGSA